MAAVTADQDRLSHDPAGRIAAVPIVAIAALLAGAVLRLALTPLTEGNDFIAFGQLATLTLHGHDVYALNVQHRLHGILPWTYLPLLLYVFTAAQWLAVHTGWSFMVLGKLPIVIADLVVGAALYAAVRCAGRSERTAVLGMCLYLFNPLVLFNGAFYGRFDAVALAFLIVALLRYRMRAFAPAYALAISAKTFPIFLIVPLAFGEDRQPPRRLALAAALVVALAGPYLVTDPGGVLHLADYVRYNFGRLSWYLALVHLGGLTVSQVTQIARGVLWLYPVALVVLVRGSRYAKAAQTFSLYLLLNQIVYEQYLLWPLPFLIVVGLAERRAAALWLAAILTCGGMLENEFTWERHGYLHYHLAPTPWPLLNVAIALSIVLYMADSYIRARRSGAHTLADPSAP